ncbi:MAG: SusC/RagA family TonB-linked outer membrane protein [Cytophagales bacterium]|nr:SusC/RagA family TonB-linked outer membrane protein [Cytophagales bacterium]
MIFSEKIRRLRGCSLIIFLLFFIGTEVPGKGKTVWLQDVIKITGAVKGQNGEALVGANVYVQGSSTGVITDIDGRFEIQAKIGDMLVFSYLGFKDLLLKVDNNTGDKPLAVQLEADAKVLKDVVVTGFQEIDRKLFTGAAQVVSMEDVDIEGNPDATQALQGRVAGVSIENVSGSFGTAPRILIRGNASLNGSNKPLWVVDGVVIEDIVEVSSDDLASGDARTLISSSIAGLNPDDIKSFEILKDASATAIYGARAMNGVIAITTKRGRRGKTSINYNGSFSVRQRPVYSDYNIMNSGQEISVYRELINKGYIDVTTAARAKNYGAVGKMYDLIAKKELTWDPNGITNEQFLEEHALANTDWFDLLFQNSLTQQHSISLSSGTDRSQYYVSLGYYNDNGQTIADNVERYTLSTRADFSIFDKLDLGINLSGSIRDQKAPGTTNREFNPIDGSFTREFDINPLGFALNSARSMKAYDAEGNYAYYRRNYAPFNILQELDNNFINIAVADISIQTDLKYSILKNLKFSTTLQYRKVISRREHRIRDESNQAEAYRSNSTQLIEDANQYLFTDPDKPNSEPLVILPVGGFYNVSDNILDNYYVRSLLTWDPSFGDDHEFTFLAGQELRLANRQSSRFDGWGYQFDRGGVVFTDPQAIRANVLNGNDYFGMNEFKDRFLGFFFTGGYAYKEKYIANFTARYDGSNQLGKTTRSRFFPTWNVSGAWNVTEEDFLIDTDWIERLKLKMTYGLSGSMGPFSAAELNAVAYVPQRPNTTDRETLLRIENLANDDLTWEKLKEFNAGVEFGFLDGRISGGLEYYQRRSYDLISAVRTSGVGGEALKLGNLFNMDSYGFEVTLNAVPVEAGNFTWSTSLTWAYNKNEITSLSLAPRIAQAITENGAASLGRARRGLYSVPFAGLDSRGIPTFFGDEGITQNMYLQDRVNEVENLIYEGSIDPLGNGGFVNSFRFKNFSLSVNFTYRYGNVIRLPDLYPTIRGFDDFSALQKEWADRWALPGDEAKTQIPAIADRLTQQELDNNSLNPYQLYNKSDIRVADGSFVRLKNVTLRYTVPQKVVKRLGLSKARLSLQGQNLGLLYSDSKLQGIDPEFFNSGGVALPVPRQYTLSVNIGF